MKYIVFALVMCSLTALADNVVQKGADKLHPHPELAPHATPTPTPQKTPKASPTPSTQVVDHAQAIYMQLLVDAKECVGISITVKQGDKARAKALRADKTLKNLGASFCKALYCQKPCTPVTVQEVVPQPTAPVIKATPAPAAKK